MEAVAIVCLSSAGNSCFGPNDAASVVVVAGDGDQVELDWCASRASACHLLEAAKDN